jgi:malonyl CoA-acyl carrier protein transacylase
MGGVMQSLFLFDGLGGTTGTFLTQLRELFQRPENARFFSVAHAAVQDALAHAGPAAYDRHLPAGLPLADWLHGRAIPEQRYFDNSIVAGVCAHVYQLCLLQPRPPDVTGESAGGRMVVALGHSLGLQAAMVAGFQLRNRHEFLDLCYQSIAFMTLCLVRCHQVETDDRIEAEFAGRYRARADAVEPPAPMASLTGIGIADLRAAVEAHNRRAHCGAVEIGLVNSARFHVLTGGTAPLIEFWLSRESHFGTTGARWSFLPNTAPFHSRVLEPAARLVEQDRGFVKPTMTGDRLRVPVYATESPRNLQDSTDLYREFLDQAVCRPLDWYATVTNAVDQCGPERVVNFGPGLAARVFTGDCLRQAGYQLRNGIISRSS